MAERDEDGKQRKLARDKEEGRKGRQGKCSKGEAEKTTERDED